MLVETSKKTNKVNLPLVLVVPVVVGRADVLKLFLNACYLQEPSNQYSCLPRERTMLREGVIIGDF